MRLQVSGLTVCRGGREIVRDVDFTVNDGEWLMLVGLNGAGKSTILRAVSGAIPCEGTVLLDGEDVRRMKPVRRALRLGMLEAGSTSAYAFTVRQIVEMGRYAHGGGLTGRGDPEGAAHVDEALRLTGLETMQHHSMLTLSSGERQRAFLAQVLCQDPVLLLLDEPASHLDLSYAKQMYELVDVWRRQPGRAVISVVHDLSAARCFGTHALLLDAGQVGAFGTVNDVLTDETLAVAWHMDVAAWMRQLTAVWQK